MSNIDNVEMWMERAKQARKLANNMTDEISKQIMLQIAENYVRMAELVRKRRERKP